MKVQQSAKVQINEIKFNALKNRHGLNFNKKGGIDEKVFREIVNEYETKIRSLEHELMNNIEVKKLKDMLQEARLERDRLEYALAMNGDRTYISKLLQVRQKEGY